jgi:hypothetical protein
MPLKILTFTLNLLFNKQLIAALDISAKLGTNKVLISLIKYHKWRQKPLVSNCISLVTRVIMNPWCRLVYWRTK